MVTTITNGLLTPREAAKLLKISKCSTYRWIKRGWLPKVTMPNGTFRIPRVVVDRILLGKK
uniref:Putative DNA binding, helix-turn-helix domain containing protein n=1 Tax=viral metagenome TaxID=1070528 RepID=A0A6M3J4B1_9ZZZZ